MNNQCKMFINYITNEAPKHNKSLVESTVVTKFALTKDRTVYHNDFFAVRFCYSKSDNFCNTVLSLSKLEKYDSIPFFVVIVRNSANNTILLANTTFLTKISHSSQTLSISNIRGSFNGSDIMREAYGKDNTPENFDYLFAIHCGLDWRDNLSRLVDATSNIKPKGKEVIIDDNQKEAIIKSIKRSKFFVDSQNFDVLKKDLDLRCEKCKNEILIASRIENINLRGRLIERLITTDDLERQQIIQDLRNIENGLPTYDTKNGLGDYCRKFNDANAYVDIKTKIIYLNSNPKAYNIDKFLKQMADGESVFLFYFIGIDENGIFKALLCSVYHSKLIDNTILQFHWAGRASRGVAQFNGSAIDEMLRDASFKNDINLEKSCNFITTLIER